MIHARTPHSKDGVQAQEYLAGWQRARAELANFRKRLQESSSEQQGQARREAVEPLLSLADNFRAMTAHVPDELQNHAWVTGVLHIARQLDEILAAYEVTAVEEVDVPFDPVRHEALESVSRTGVASGTVVEVVQPGYVMGETVLRAAKVRVAQ